MRLYIDSKSDESYAPKTITIQAGDHPTMMFDYATVKLDNTEGWVEMDLKESGDIPLESFSLRIVITCNQQSGRDTRIRGLKIFGQPESLQGIK